MTTTVTWEGGGNDKWSNSADWNGGIPTSTDAVSIPGSTATVILDSTTGSTTVASVDVASGGAWQAAADGDTVTISGNFEDDGGFGVDTGFLTTPGGTTIVIDGTLTVTNSGAGFVVGNRAQTVATTVDVSAITNSVVVNGTLEEGVIEIAGAYTNPGGVLAQIDVGTAAGFNGLTGVLTGNIDLGIGVGGGGGSGDALLDFEGGGLITTIESGTVSLYGPLAYIASGTTTGDKTSNSALTGPLTIAAGGGNIGVGTLELQDGVNISTSAITDNGNLDVDGGFEGTAGSDITISGALTVTGSLSIGRTGMIGIGLVTAGSLSNTGTISLNGASSNSNEGKLEIAAAAGFGTAQTLTGNVNLSNYALLQFASGWITTIAQGAELQFSGGNAFIADAGSITTNSALTGLTAINGGLNMQTDVTIAPTGPLTIGSDGHVSIDSGFLAVAGSKFEVTDALTVNGSLGIGRSAMTGNSEVTAGSLLGTGTITVNGADASDMGELIIGSAAGFGGTGVVTGSITVENYSLAEFTGGSINTIDFGGAVEIIGAHAFIADTGSLTTNGALSSLATVGGDLTLLNGASVTDTNAGGVTVGNGTNGAYISVANGASFSVTGTLNLLSGEIGMSVGGNQDAASPTVTVGALVNPDTINIEGDPGEPTVGTLKINGALSGAGTINLSGGADLEIGTTATGGGVLAFSVSGGAGGTVKLDTATTLGDAFSDFTVGDTIDIASLTYKASYVAVWSATTSTSGTLNVEDSANGNAVVASFTFINNSNYANFKFSVNNDGGDTSVTFTNTPVGAMKADYFIAYESKTGDQYDGFVYDNQGKYAVGSTFVSPTDQAGGTWTYYVYNIAATSNVSSNYNGQVYDYAFYDKDQGATPLTPFYYGLGYASGQNFLGSDTDYILENGTYEKFSDYYVVPDMKADYFLAYESKTGDVYYGYTYDDQGKYAVGSTFVSPTDQAGGTWTYYVYSVAAAPNVSTVYNGQVYDTAYYDKDRGAAPYTPFYDGLGYASGQNFLGSDTDYILENGAYQKFSDFNVVPDTKLDYFIAYESKTGDEYYGYVVDSFDKYAIGSSVVTPTDQAGGTWTYYVYATASSSLPTNYNGQVYDTAYYDKNVSSSPFTPFYDGIGYASGQNFLGSDTDYILENNAYQKFGNDGFYVVGGASGASGSGGAASQSYTPYGANPTNFNVAASSGGSAALYTAPSNQNPLAAAA
jgi:hypothetical protein